MAARKPLVAVGGSVQELASGDSITIPLNWISAAGATADYVIKYTGGVVTWAPDSTGGDGGGGISHATSDGRKWASKDGAWEPITTYYSSSTQPTVPSGNRVPGDKWLNLATGEELTWVWDGNTGQWVNFHGGPAVAGGGAGIDFPSPTTGLHYTYNGVTYVFDGLAWQIQGGGAGAYYENRIDRPPTTPNSWDDEFVGTTLDASWTMINGTNGGASASATVSDGSLWIKDDVAISGQARLLSKNLPSGDFTVVAKLILHGANTFNNAGIGVFDHNSPAFRGIRTVMRSDSPFGTIGLLSFADPNGFTSASESALGVYPPKLYFKVKRTGNFFEFFVSANGEHFSPHGSWTETTMTKFVILYSNFNTTNADVSRAEVQWVRRVA